MISIHGDGAELRATAQTRPCLRVARATHPTIRASTQCYTVLECAAICAFTQCFNFLLHSSMMCSHTVIQCAVMCFHTLLQCATVCYSVLQCVTVCCSVLHTDGHSTNSAMHFYTICAYHNNLVWYKCTRYVHSPTAIIYIEVWLKCDDRKD